MKQNFEACLTETLAHEGGFSNHPKDPGGATQRGVIQRTYDAWRKNRGLPRRSVREISDTELRAIYREDFWNVIRGDDLPAGIDLVTFDASVNSGTGRGPKWTQAALGVAADGKVGPATIEAARKAVPVDVVQRACALRMGFLRGLRIWSTFGKGWSRRVAAVEAAGTRLAVTSRGVTAKPLLVEQAGQAKASQRREATTAAGTGAGGTGGIGFADMPDWAVYGGVALVCVLVLMFLGRAMHERHRAEALSLAAEKET